MNKPEPKVEISISRCPNPEALQIDMATQPAVAWVKQEARSFTNDGLYGMFDRHMQAPAKMVLVISPCFDIDEVAEYLSTPTTDQINAAYEALLTNKANT